MISYLDGLTWLWYVLRYDKPARTTPIDLFRQLCYKLIDEQRSRIFYGNALNSKLTSQRTRVITWATRSRNSGTALILIHSQTIRIMLINRWHIYFEHFEYALRTLVVVLPWTYQYSVKRNRTSPCAAQQLALRRFHQTVGCQLANWWRPLVISQQVLPAFTKSIQNRIHK